MRTRLIESERAIASDDQWPEVADPGAGVFDLPANPVTSRRRGWLPVPRFSCEIEDRVIPGHWEGDLIGGTKNSHIATLVERQSRFAMLVKVSSKDTATVVAALSRHVHKLPASLWRSLTWDREWEVGVAIWSRFYELADAKA